MDNILPVALTIFIFIAFNYAVFYSRDPKPIRLGTALLAAGGDLIAVRARRAQQKCASERREIREH